MKTLDVREAEGQLAQLIAEASEGEVIVIRNGDKEVTLRATATGEPEWASPELEAELLKAAKGPFTPYSRADLEAVAQRVLQEKQRQ